MAKKKDSLAVEQKRMRLLIASRIKDAMKMRELYYPSALANKMGRDRALIHLWLRGNSNLTINTLVEISRALNVEPCYLVRRFWIMSKYRFN